MLDCNLAFGLFMYVEINKTILHPNTIIVISQGKSYISSIEAFCYSTWSIACYMS